MTTSVPVATLTALGLLIAVLGLFVAGTITMTIIGLVAVFGAGILEVALRRSS